MPCFQVEIVIGFLAGRKTTLASSSDLLLAQDDAEPAIKAAAPIPAVFKNLLLSLIA
jgi:hypothetical protein